MKSLKSVQTQATNKNIAHSHTEMGVRIFAIVAGSALS